eukprot:gb/GEZN01005122.1/.p1 GENE.gb/GEZN01005122.1/~~gb/GEZN01005122.1/.p1  ORF type:complete len:349 (+),score=65.78 gb/GEZN01005122.1/:32-1078(+)
MSEATSEVKLTVGSIPSSSPHKTLVTVASTASLEEALALMDKNNVQSLPIVGKDKKVIGVINTIDILTRVVFDKAFSKDDVKTADLLEIAKANSDLMKRIEVSDAMGLSLESKTTWLLKSSDKLNKLLNVMCSGVHRVLVVESDDTEEEEGEEGEQKQLSADPQKGLRFISQRDLCRFLATHFKKHKATEAVLKLKVKEVANKQGVVCVMRGKRVLDTFKAMLLNNEMNALPIVDEHNKLLDTVSVSDVRQLRADNLDCLLLPIEDYVSQSSHRESQARYNVTCKQGDVVAAVLSSILASRVHRAWVVDDKNEPIASFSFTDLLKAIFCYVPEPALPPKPKTKGGHAL